MAKSERFAFLDVLRGFAVLWMIQVHITNVLLDPALRTTWYFDLLNISNGFVAPTFIFCAGAGLWIALERKGAAYLQRGREMWMYIRRLGYILFWAYMLHVPYFSLERMLMDNTDLLPWLQIDVLQTIVYTSLAALGIYLIVRDLRKATLVYGVLGLTIMLCTAFVWQTKPNEWLPDSLAITILPFPFSPFPLLPWACYLFIGAFSTGIFIRSGNKQKLARRWLIGSFFAIPIVFVIKAFHIDSPWTDVWWSSSPGMHIFRIAGVVFVMSLLFLFEQRLRESRFGVTMQKIGNESLFLYISHLLIVYGNVSMITKSLTGVEYTGYLGVLIAWIVLTIPLLFITFKWHEFKRKRPDLVHRFLIIQMCWMVVSLILTPADFSLVELFGLE